MYTGKIKFSTLPDIGFAIRHYSFDYKTTYGGYKNSRVEIAYINSGNIVITLEDKEMYAPEGSIAVLFRQLPISTRTVGNELHSHDTVLAEFDDLEFTLGESDQISEGALVIPFVTPPSDKTEKIGIALRRIISDMASDREENALGASLAFVGILKELADMHCDQKSSEIVEKTVAKIRKYIDMNIQNRITVREVSHYAGKSPNYIGKIFKSHMGMSISSYVNMQKVKKISLFIKNRDTSFKEACEAVSLYDEAYGYRLFKKYMGLTPGEFLSVKHIERDKKK